LGEEGCPACGATIDLEVVETCPQCDWVNTRLVYEPEWRPGSAAGKVAIGVLLVAVTAGVTYFLTREKAAVPNPNQAQAQVAAGQKPAPAQTTTPARKRPKARRARKKYSKHPCSKLHRECTKYRKRLRKAQFSRRPNMSKTFFYQLALKQCAKANSVLVQFQSMMGYSGEVNRQMAKSGKRVCKMYRQVIKQLPRRF